MNVYEQVVELLNQALSDAWMRGVEGQPAPLQADARDLTWKFIVLATHHRQESQ